MSAVNVPFNEQIVAILNVAHSSCVSFAGLIQRFDEVDDWRKLKPYATKIALFRRKFQVFPITAYIQSEQNAALRVNMFIYFFFNG